LVTNTTPARPGSSEVSTALDRLLASTSFARSSRLAAFLRFIVEERLSGSETPLKEYILGVQVFDRDPNYDPRIDPIVRVQARQLRFKLREYYETAGSADPIRIEMPKGSYLPEITYAPSGGRDESIGLEPTPQLESETVVSALAIASAPAVSPPLGPGRRWKIRWISAAAALAAITLASVLFARLARPSPNGRTGAADPAAQELYLKGKFYWNKRSPESLNQAVDYFNQAIVRDPGYAKAYSGLADCYNLLREYSIMPPSVAWPKATAAARKAVELDNSSAEAHASLGFALFYGSLDTVGGEREYRRAIELDPNYEKAHHWYATSLMAIGRMREAYVEIERARELDPASPSILSDEGYILFFSGQIGRAIDLLKQVENVDPASQSPHVYLARIYLDQGDSANYLAESRQAAELSHDVQALALLAAAQDSFGSKGILGMLETILEHQKTLLAEGRSTYYEVAQTYARLGKRDQAVDQLQAAFEHREMNILVMGQDPIMASLRGEPRFQSLCAKVKATLRI
jgi:tetratricopeptide (TPR) repeat protein